MSRKASTACMVIVLLMAGALFAGCGQQEATMVTPQGPQGPQDSSGGPLRSGATADDVPVVIEAYYPLNEGHKWIADYVLGVGEANPGTVSVAVYDMQSAEGREKWAATGLTCAGVFVNGSTTHELQVEGQQERVGFLKRMGVVWTHEDFETVVARELEKAGKTFNAPPPPVEPKPAEVVVEEPAPEEADAEESAENGQ